MHPTDEMYLHQSGTPFGKNNYVADVCQTLYNINNVFVLFTNVTGYTVLNFLKEINLYTKI